MISAEISKVIVTNTTSNTLSEIQNSTKLDNYQELEPDIEDFCKLDILGINTTDKSALNILDAFTTTVTKQDKRYQVAWPWRENYKLCNERLKSLCKRLTEKRETLKLYDEIIKDQLQRAS